ncbi:GlpG protein [Alteromonadaceae bacterium Bs31]|nr:GlpG protein [Alteromonadaceae bacterium Bs31]
MNWNKIAEFPGDSQLKHLHEFLDAHGVKHRFTEEGGKQILWLVDLSKVKLVSHYFETLKHGTRPEIPKQTGKEFQGKPVSLPQYLRLFPLSIGFIVLGLLGFLIADVFYYPPLLKHLTFLPIEVAIRIGEPWRVISPVFLHFGLLHILFNGLWMWELGKRIELFSGRPVFLLLFLSTSLGGNYLEFLVMDTINFGGLSGVVYGLFAYIWLWARFSSSPLLKLPSGIYIFLIVWLVIGFAGVIRMFFGIDIANWAHLGGLIAGLLSAAIHITVKNRWPGVKNPGKSN